MRRRGISLIELLVVMAIIGVALGLLVPAIVGGRAAASRTQCQNNLKQVSLALLIYHDEHQVFPPGLSGREDPTGGSAWGWARRLLIHMEQTSLSRAIDAGESLTAPENQTARVSRLSSMLCPADGGRGGPGDVPIGGAGSPPGAWPNNPPSSPYPDVAIAGDGPRPIVLAPASYVGSFGTGDPLDPAQARRGDGVFFRDSAIGLLHLEDGSSTTFLVGERNRVIGPSTWVGAAGDRGAALVLGSTGQDGGPNALPRRPSQFGSAHGGGAYFTYADGGVRFVRDGIGSAIYRALATRAGAEVSADLAD